MTKELKDLCGSYLQARLTAIIFNILSGVVITLMNIFLRIVFHALVRFQRFATLSSEAGSTISKYFTATFINTALVPILAQSDIYGFKLSDSFRKSGRPIWKPVISALVPS